MFLYIQKLWALRYFIFLLVFNDLAQRYRRSYLGVMWTVIQPLMFALIVTFVIGRFVEQPFWDFFPFVFIGFAVWELIASSIALSPMVFVSNAQYIKQYNNSLMAFSVRLSLLGATNFIFALGGVIIILFLVGEIKIGFSFLTLPINLLLVIFLLIPIINIVALFGTIFRDLQQLVALVLQAVFYFSPILFKPEFYIDFGVGVLLKLNPVFYAINHFRKPILENQLPHLNDYIAILGMSLFAYTLNAACIAMKERKIINYI